MIPSLPEELLDRIISHIPPSLPSTLYNLCLVSRDLNRLATTHLYTTLVLDERACTRLRSLALLLFTSPTHAALVRSFTIVAGTGVALGAWPEFPYPRPVQEIGSGKDGTRGQLDTSTGQDALTTTGQLDNVIRDPIERYVRSESEREKWFKQIRYGRGVLELASLVLRCCPNVKELRFEGLRVVDSRKLEPGEEGWVEAEIGRRAR